MDKLNICLCSLTVSPDRPDGEASVFKGYYDYLKSQGHNVKILTGKWNFNLNDSNILQFDLIKKRFLWAPQFNFKVIKYLRSHKFDIIHGNGPKGTLPIILSNQKRLISTIHDLGPFETKFQTIPIEKYLIKNVVRRSTYIATDSEFVKKEIKLLFPKVDPKKIFTLYTGIDKKFRPYPIEGQKLREKLNLQGPVMLYIGRIATYKGVGDIIKAYNIAKKTISDLNLVIGGNPDYNMAKIYENWKQKYGNIHFIGFVPEEELPFYYSMADVFVNYSFASEGFGLTPIESIACGTPVIASALPVFKEILKDNAIIIPPKNPQKLAEEIISSIKNEEHQKDLLQKAQKFIKRYTWDEVGKRLEDLYQKFLSN